MKTKQVVVRLVLIFMLTNCGGSATNGATQHGSRSPAPASTGVVPTHPLVEPAAINASGLLGGNASPNAPAGEAGKVSVVLIGPVPTDQHELFSVPIVVRNNTDRPVGRIQVAATARDATGKLVPGLERDANDRLAAIGRSLGFNPTTVRPGELALGSLSFSPPSSIPADATFSFTIETSEPSAGGPFDSVSLKVTAARLVGRQVTGTAVNPTGTPIDGPFDVEVFCFDGSGKLGAVTGDVATPTKLEARGTASFLVDTEGPCTTFLVAVSTVFRIPHVTVPR